MSLAQGADNSIVLRNIKELHLPACVEEPGSDENSVYTICLKMKIMSIYEVSAMITLASLQGLGNLGRNQFLSGEASYTVKTQSQFL